MAADGRSLTAMHYPGGAGNQPPRYGDQRLRDRNAARFGTNLASSPPYPESGMPNLIDSEAEEPYEGTAAQRPWSVARHVPYSAPWYAAHGQLPPRDGPPEARLPAPRGPGKGGAEHTTEIFEENGVLYRWEQARWAPEWHCACGQRGNWGELPNCRTCGKPRPSHAISEPQWRRVRVSDLPGPATAHQVPQRGSAAKRTQSVSGGKGKSRPPRDLTYMDPLEKSLIEQREILISLEGVYGPQSAVVLAAREEYTALEAQVTAKGSTLSALLISAEDEVRMTNGLLLQAQIKRDRLADELHIADNEVAEAQQRARVAQRELDELPGKFAAPPPEAQEILASVARLRQQVDALAGATAAGNLPIAVVQVKEELNRAETAARRALGSGADPTGAGTSFLADIGEHHRAAAAPAGDEVRSTSGASGIRPPGPNSAALPASALHSQPASAWADAGAPDVDGYMADDSAFDPATFTG